MYIAKNKIRFEFFFMAQLAFKQAKFYFRMQNDRAKGRMGPSWIMWRHLQNSYFESSIAGEKSCFVFPDFSYYKQQM